ncbi:hypothetical protein WJX81_006646 [Elliptochloris bilobata]|uniref:CGL160/ATPI domain-containing protein n=1 Tax=Elliptochloris bilobata TaxID=381761 RepID=A0AAW1RWZ1_9CHLO
MAAQAGKLPSTGYFSDADPNEEVYAPLSGMETGDLTKRGGRYTPEFIWNVKWQDQLDYQDALARAQREAAEEGEPVQTVALSFGRVAELNSLDVDLSEQLRARKAPPAAPSARPSAEGLDPSTRASAAGEAVAAQQRALFRRGRPNAGFASNPPSKGEARRWERNTRFAKRVVTAPSINVGDVAAREAAAEAENVRYSQLKGELMRWAVALAACGSGAVVALGSQDAAASYMVGALGGLVYLRQLQRSVDGFGAFAAGAAGGQTRLLIPVALALAFNRWNALYAAPTGVELQMLPLLGGFFTYKLAVVGRWAASAVAAAQAARAGRVSGEPDNPQAEAQSSAEADTSSGGFDARSVDHVFNKGMLAR